MKNALVVILLSGLLLACQDPPSTTSSPTFVGLNFETTVSPELEYEYLRLYPIYADDSFISKNVIAQHLRTLGQAVDTYGFRITEKKPFGRFEDRNAVNTLTIQNKSKDTIFLMQGDLVQGGRQDRVLAQNMIITPRSIQDIAVFCVEPNRWHLEGVEDESQMSEQQQRKAIAFNGYYHVAATKVREIVKHEPDQQAVWDQVGKIVNFNNANTSTGAYDGLEGSNDFTQKRDAYLRFYQGKFDQTPSVVGVLAVSGHQILGVDIFGHPELFKNKIHDLLHSYITEVITNGSEVAIKEETVKAYAKKVLQQLGTHNEQLFDYEEAFIHYSSL